MAVLWSRHLTYPSCRQCQACGSVFTFSGDQVVAGEHGPTTPCQECNAPVPVGSAEDPDRRTEPR